MPIAIIWNYILFYRKNVDLMYIIYTSFQNIRDTRQQKRQSSYKLLIFLRVNYNQNNGAVMVVMVW